MDENSPNLVTLTDFQTKIFVIDGVKTYYE
jgi:hypothetical protein